MVDVPRFDVGVVGIANFQLFTALCQHLKLTQDEYDELFLQAAERAKAYQPDQAADVVALLKRMNKSVASRL